MPRKRKVPSPETIVSVTRMTSPKGGAYRILRTTQVDEYEEPEAIDRPRSSSVKKTGAKERKKGKS